MFEFTRQNISLQVLFERRLFHSLLQLVINLQVWRQFLHFTLQLQHKVNNKSQKTEPYTDEKTVTDLPFLTLRTFSAASNVSLSSVFSCLCLFCSSATKNTNSDWWCHMKHKTWDRIKSIYLHSTEHDYTEPCQVRAGVFYFYNFFFYKQR